MTETDLEREALERRYEALSESWNRQRDREADYAAARDVLLVVLIVAAVFGPIAVIAGWI